MLKTMQICKRQEYWVWKLYLPKCGRPSTACLIGSDRLRQAVRAGVNQQPPVQDELVQAILGMNKNTSSSPAQGFFSPLLCPKFFPPTYFPPPTSLTSFNAHSISTLHLQSSGELPSLSSTEFWGDVLRRCETQDLRNVESSTLKECGEKKERFIPNIQVREER